MLKLTFKLNYINNSQLLRERTEITWKKLESVDDRKILKSDYTAVKKEEKNIWVTL